MGIPGFVFNSAGSIVFGRGKAAEMPKIASAFGKRMFVLTGSNPDRYGELLDALKREGTRIDIHRVEGEPTVEMAAEAAERARRMKADAVIGIGGGSVIDLGKAVSALLTNERDLFDYLEVIGKGEPLLNRAAPYVAIPTTAGTGAEVTRNAVLGSKEHGVKVSMRSALMIPLIALVDPALTDELPQLQTASTGLDALTQLIEAFVTWKANPMTDALCREGIRHAGVALRVAFDTGDPVARDAMSIASLFSGLALANAGLGAVHGFAGPLGGMIQAPHGVICARLLPPVMRMNLRALRDREPDQAVLLRYTEVAKLLTGEAEPEAGMQWTAETVSKMNVPKLSTYGLTEDLYGEAIEKSRRASSMKGNPIQLTDDELRGILEAEAAAD